MVQGTRQKLLLVEIGEVHINQVIHQPGVGISHRLRERWQTLCGLHTPEIFKLIDFWIDKFLSSEYEFLEVTSLCLSHLETTVNSPEVLCGPT